MYGCFNPRAREGRDAQSAAPLRCSRCFNPRAREGRDVRGSGRRGALPGVSIHAPVRGATQDDGAGSRAPERFNPRAREGRDLAESSRLLHPDCFNPRAREGRDAAPGQRAAAHRGRFNPRAREGRDVRQFNIKATVDLVSIHAPVRGATYRTRAHIWAVRVSIHAPVRGATRVGRNDRAMPGRFNPRAREGRDTG